MGMVFLLAVLCMLVGCVRGHGYLFEPPSRNNMWRRGFDTPFNYDDNQLFCGGKEYQWAEERGGKCGVCGDPYDGNRPHEYPGKYATGTIGRCYSTQKSKISVTIKLSAYHKGYFEFRLCPHNNVNKTVTHECLNQNVLTVSGTGSTRYSIQYSEHSEYTFELDIPEGLTCTQCVLQWLYNTGNSWGYDFDNPSLSGLGLGPQEQFINCADIAILENCGNFQGPTVYTVPTSSPPSRITSETNTATETNEPTTTNSQFEPTTTETFITNTATETNEPTTTNSQFEPTTTETFVPTEPTDDTYRPGNCRAISPYDEVPYMHDWCEENCGRDPPYCPETHCICDYHATADEPVSLLVCHGVGLWVHDARMADWCNDNCNHDPVFCPDSLCSCELQWT